MVRTYSCVFSKRKQWTSPAQNLAMDLSSIVAIDQHAHNLLKAEVASQIPFAAAFSEGSAPNIIKHHARHTLFYRRSLRDIATLFNCDPTEEAIHHYRETLGLEPLARQCFDAANLESILLDDGFMPNAILPCSWHQQFTSVHRLIRLEYLAEQLIANVDRFDVFLEWFRSEIDPLPEQAVGFKSIAAYRTGLDIQFVYQEVAEDYFYNLKQKQAKTQQPIRLSEKALIDFLLLEALEVATKYEIPIQFHTGFGDPDLDLRLSNPLHLRPILEEPRYESVPIVLLHASYPFTREAGFLASVYPQVYVDFGLAIPSLSVRGMQHIIHQLLELAPTSKIMYSSDAHLIPELFYLGAKWGRETLGHVLDAAIHDGDLSSLEAEAAAIAILCQNARQLYFKTEI